MNTKTKDRLFSLVVFLGCVGWYLTCLVLSLGL